MSILQIIQLILALVPTGVTITQDILGIITGIEGAINGTPGTPAHTAAVTQLAAIAASVTPQSSTTSILDSEKPPAV
jgi:hypothetical protein